jgi:hypothetical protein
VKKVISSGLFDRDWYTQVNSDIDFDKFDPIVHFLTIGWLEGRNPHPYFDTSWYQSRNPDVEKAGINPLEHYIDHGAAEGRDPHPGFLSVWYEQTYSDSIDPGTNLLLHYCQEGRQKRFRPHPNFEYLEDWSPFNQESRPDDREAPDLESELCIGFAVSDDSIETTAGDFFSASELGSALQEAFGWQVRFLAKSNLNNSWYDVSGVDCLIVMLEDYDLNRIFGVGRNLITIAWMRNWFDNWAVRPWIHDYDVHLCTSLIAQDFFNSATSIEASIFRLATNHRKFSRSVKRSNEHASDVCFTGNYWNSPRDIESLDPSRLNLSFGLYGSGWENHPRFRKYWRGAVKYDEINVVYASSKLVIDDANIATKKWGSVNSRVFDALATGTLVLSNSQSGSSELFNGLLPTYEVLEELEHQIKYYLANNSVRQELAEKLNLAVRSHHTYRNRAQELLVLLETSIASIGLKSQ